MDERDYHKADRAMGRVIQLKHTCIQIDHVKESNREEKCYEEENIVM